MDSLDLDDILQRLKRLERENRRLKRVGLAVLGLGAALAIGAALPDPVPDVIEAHSFRLLDADGHRRAILMVDEPTAKRPVGDAALRLLDGHDRAPLSLRADAEGGAFVMLGSPEPGDTRITLSTFPKENATMALTVANSSIDVTSSNGRLGSLLNLHHRIDPNTIRTVTVGLPKGPGIDVVEGPWPAMAPGAEK